MKTGATFWLVFIRFHAIVPTFKNREKNVTGSSIESFFFNEKNPSCSSFDSTCGGMRGLIRIQLKNKLKKGYFRKIEPRIRLGLVINQGCFFLFYPFSFNQVFSPNYSEIDPRSAITS